MLLGHREPCGGAGETNPLARGFFRAPEFIVRGEISDDHSVLMRQLIGTPGSLASSGPAS